MKNHRLPTSSSKHGQSARHSAETKAETRRYYSSRPNWRLLGEKETAFHFKFKTAGARRRHSALPNPRTLVNVSVPFPDCLDSNHNWTSTPCAQHADRAQSISSLSSNSYRTTTQIEPLRCPFPQLVSDLCRKTTLFCRKREKTSKSSSMNQA